MAQQLPSDAEVAHPGSYRELYAAAGYQTGEPELEWLVASYRFTEVAGGGERLTPAHLRVQTFALSDRRSMTFLCLARMRGTSVEVRVLRRMMRYFELPGGGCGGMVDLNIGLLGDARAAQIPVVKVDNSHFSLIGGTGVRVPTVAGMLDLLAVAPLGTYLGPYAIETPGTELVCPRATQMISIKYAASSVHRDGVSLDTTYQELHGMFAADDVLERVWMCWLGSAWPVRRAEGPEMLPHSQR